jgi:predicted ArsR family transcriptional regulator
MMDRAQILAEIITLSALPLPVREDEITVREYADASGLGPSAAKRRLDQLVDAGQLAVRDATTGQGHPCRAYRKVV